MERGLDPLKTNLVVADESRTDKTVCLAVSPTLKSLGIGGRARLFEVKQKVEQANRARKAPIKFIIAPPRMAKYIEVSTQIYATYLEFVAPTDIFVYSIDEVFIDATHYLESYHLTGKELAQKIVGRIFEKTGITATAGIGTNLYLAKVAMDILAKHAEPDQNGARLAELNEQTYREQLWEHTPITDFWRVGPGYRNRLQKIGLKTMGDICLASQTEYGEKLLYKTFGINAELLIDHAWGWEPTEISEVKNYQPRASSLSSGQVLKEPYAFEPAGVALREMAEVLALDLVEKKLLTDQIVLTIGYDHVGAKNYTGETVRDRHGRILPKPAHGSQNLDAPTNSARAITKTAQELFEKIVDPTLKIRRLNIVANHTVSESAPRPVKVRQLSLFGEAIKPNFNREKEHNLQEAELKIKAKFGKNAILKGTDFKVGATMRERNQQIGGHKA